MYMADTKRCPLDSSQFVQSVSPCHMLCASNTIAASSNSTDPSSSKGPSQDISSFRSLSSFMPRRRCSADSNSASPTASLPENACLQKALKSPLRSISSGSQSFNASAHSVPANRRPSKPPSTRSCISRCCKTICTASALEPCAGLEADAFSGPFPTSSRSSARMRCRDKRDAVCCSHLASINPSAPAELHRVPTSAGAHAWKRSKVFFK
mmetsp:Transcript_52237/g.124562  ORF Transcript_52237/g.124562 Transcript_52237/m.124562 type:complete len:210 (+) Transcript_52237:1270-1899(+)